MTTAAVLAAVAGGQTASRAHFIWATVENGQARFALLENIAEKPNPDFVKYVTATALSPRFGGKTLAGGTLKDGARYIPLGSPGTGLSAPFGTVSAESIVGVKERGGETYLLVYHAKGSTLLVDSSQMTKSPAEILAARTGDQLKISVRQFGKPVPAGEVWVQWPGETEAKTVKTNALGYVNVPWPAASGLPGGFVGIRTMVTERKPGKADGKPYASIHRWATLTFPVGGGAPPPVEKPFTQLLRASYAGKHEVVSSSEFNKTLFAEKLTKPQLIVHLQQRALVHAAVDRILTAPGVSKAVPYGDAQKNVLTLLRSDLVQLGVGWPADADARPLTKAFLETIRESAKQGPYFALGVQHVYYGGITNGGRTIGQMIADQVKFTPTYYLQSDGYTEYLPKVNEITDADARKEMIRGGQAAYAYIIASSNEDVFKTATTVSLAPRSR